jgi:phage shock protein PspC (stress-responsive transcriptional regulator)
MDSEKKLVRPREGRMIAGVCAGVARYFGLDPTLIRLLWVLALCLAGTGILAYLLCWLVIPEEA